MRFQPFRIIAIVALLLTTSPSFAASVRPDDITGVWQTRTGAYVQIYRDGQGYDGRIVGSTNGKPRDDTNNPNPTEKGRRLLGVVVLHHLTSEGDGRYDDGDIYDPNNGKSYSANARLVDMDTLEVRGYVGFSLLGKSQTWHRIAPDAAHVHSELLHQPVGAPPSKAAS